MPSSVPSPSLEPHPLFSSGSLVLRVILDQAFVVLLWFGPQPNLVPGPVFPCSWGPLTHLSLQEPFHSTWPQGFRSRTSFTFSSLYRALGKEEKLSCSGPFLKWGEGGGLLSCPEGWGGSGERIPYRELSCLVKETNHKFAVKWQNLSTSLQDSGLAITLPSSKK